MRALSLQTKRFIAHERGNVAMIFAVSMLPLMALIGFSVDYAIQSRDTAMLQSIADSAALSAMGGDYLSATDAQKIQRAKDFITGQAANLKLGNVTPTVTITDGKMKIGLSMASNSPMKTFSKMNATIDITSFATSAPAVTANKVLDVAMCIDSTGSMQDTINAVKTNAIGFYTNMNNALLARGLGGYDAMRVRLLFFRDYSADYWSDRGQVAAMVQFPFATLPASATTFQANVNGTTATGGGDRPESAHECFALAMSSPWLKVGDPYPGDASRKVTQASALIVLWTDAPPQPIPDAPQFYYSWNWLTWRYDIKNYTREGTDSSIYPTNQTLVPRSETAFKAKWMNQNVIDQNGKMYVMFGPCTPDSQYSDPDGYNGWRFALTLDRTTCAGSKNDGTTNMINKIVDGIVEINRKASPPRLTY